MSPVPLPPPQIAALLARYVAEEILADGSHVDLEQNLLGEGVVDSLGMLRLVGYIESFFDIKISPAHFTIQNFRNLSVISEFVASVVTEGDP